MSTESKPTKEQDMKVFPPSLGMLRETYLKALDSPEPYPSLHRVCRELAAKGAPQNEQRDVLLQLVQSAWGKQWKQEYQDAVYDTLDSVVGFCPMHSRIYPDIPYGADTP